MTATHSDSPGGDGLYVSPPRDAWAGLLVRNAEMTRSWEFRVADVEVTQLRALARAEVLGGALAFSSRCVGIAGELSRPEPDPAVPIVMTGHQPEFYHPGVWVKDFLVDALSDELGVTGVDLVVDSDAFAEIGVTAPCLQPTVHRCSAVLAVAERGGCFADTPVPPREAIAGFCAEVDGMLAALPSTEVAANFKRFGECLVDSAGLAANVAELMTFARRRFEASAKTRYLELPVTEMSASSAFGLFAADIARRGHEFLQAYNAELEAFRKATGTRSAAQPFPNLACEDERCELPFWLLGTSGRSTLWTRGDANGDMVLYADETELGRVGDDSEACARILTTARIAPKALTLTLFARVFVADLLIHGTGGARYDRVTDGVIRRYYGVEPPAFAVASLTERLPLGVATVNDEDVAAAVERLNRFEHNPDAMLEEADFASPDDRSQALSLAREKGELVRGIAEPSADKKAMGSRIREINAALRELLAPFGEALKLESERVLSEREDARILTDRTYPYCFWAPETIAARVR